MTLSKNLHMAFSESPIVVLNKEPDAGQKLGGQALLGGLDCLVHRNFFGGQIHSFEAAMPMPECFADPTNTPFRCVHPLTVTVHVTNSMSWPICRSGLSLKR